MATTPATEYRDPSGVPVDGIVLAEQLLDIAERAEAYTNAAGVAIAVTRGQELLVRTSTGAAPEVGTVIPISDAFIAECLQRRKPLCCRDSESDVRVGPVFRALKVRSLIAIPISGQPQPRGVMLVIAPLPNAFQPTHTAILMTLSDIISSKLAIGENSPAVQQVLATPTPAVVPEPAAKKPAVKEMPVIAPVPAMAAPPAVQVESKTTTVQPQSAPAKQADLPAAAAVAAPAGTTIVPVPTDLPPALWNMTSLPLVGENKAGRDPGLLSPSEDPRNFTAQRPVPTSSPRPELVKPAAKLADAMPASPAPIKSASTRPAAAPIKIVPTHVLAEPIQMMPAPAAPVRLAVTPVMPSWDVPRQQPAMRRFLVPGLAVAAAIVVAAALWMYDSTPAKTATSPVSIPAEPVELPSPSPVRVAAQAVAKTQPVVKVSIQEHPQPKPSKPAETEAPPPAPKHVIEIAAARPQPKLESELEVPAPNLAPASNDAGLANLGKVTVAVPAPPKSELVAATLVSRVAPVYPMIAKQLGIRGTVSLHVTIAADGSVKGVQVVDGALQLRQAAMEAVRQWRYKPAMLNGKTVESSAQVQINFSR